MSLVTVAEVKTHLGIPSAVTTWDSELTGFIDAAQPVVEDLAGVVTSRVITGETHDGGSPTIVTLYGPVISVQSVTEYVGTSAFVLTSQPQGATTNNYGYELTDSTGVLTRRGASGVPIPFQSGPDGVVVNYTAGYSSLPANVRLGALELIRHWYQRSQLGGRPTFQSDAADDGSITVGAYLVPNFVASLLIASPMSSRRIPGIA